MEFSIPLFGRQPTTHKYNTNFLVGDNKCLMYIHIIYSQNLGILIWKMIIVTKT